MNTHPRGSKSRIKAGAVKILCTPFHVFTQYCRSGEGATELFVPGRRLVWAVDSGGPASQASQMPRSCTGHSCVRGSAMLHDKSPIRPEMAPPGIRFGRSSGGTSQLGPATFFSCARFGPLECFPGDEPRTSMGFRPATFSSASET